MKPCCHSSILAYLKKHRDVAICDGCGHLLLAYGNQRDFEEAEKALLSQGIPFEVEQRGPLRILLKPRQKPGGLRKR
jgi:hypothetical protein